MLLASYPLLLILAKMSSKHWNPHSPFKFIKDTVQSLLYLWQKIYELCLVKSCVQIPPQDTDKLLDALEALIGNSIGTIPNDSSVEIHEASGKASSIDAYDKLIRYCRSEISIALPSKKDSDNKKTDDKMSSVSCCTICNSISLFPSRPIPHHPTSSHLSHHSYIFISLGFIRMRRILF